MNDTEHYGTQHNGIQPNESLHNDNQQTDTKHNNDALLIQLICDTTDHFQRFSECRYTERYCVECHAPKQHHQDTRPHFRLFLGSIL